MHKNDRRRLTNGEVENYDIVVIAVSVDGVHNGTNVVWKKMETFAITDEILVTGNRIDGCMSNDNRRRTVE